MRFEMFTEHGVEICALHIIFFNLNQFFLSVCMQHTDKSVPRKWFFGGIFDTLYCRTAGASRPLDPLGPAAAPGNDPRSLHIVPSAGYHFHPFPHDKFGPPL